jgi:hypothetical protein
MEQGPAWDGGQGGLDSRKGAEGQGGEEEEKGKGTRFSFFTGCTVPSYNASSRAKTSTMIDI